MHQPLLIKNILMHARRTFPATEIVSRTDEESTKTHSIEEIGKRAAQLSHALIALKIKTGDRVATLAWNDHRHLELYYAVSGIGAVCHTINPRLPQKQLGYIIEHANDALIFVDEGLVGLLDAVLRLIKNRPKIIVLADAGVPLPLSSSGAELLNYEEMIANYEVNFINLSVKNFINNYEKIKKNKRETK